MLHCPGFQKDPNRAICLPGYLRNILQYPTLAAQTSANTTVLYRFLENYSTEKVEINLDR